MNAVGKFGLVVAILAAGPAQAAGPAMTCEWYTVGKNGLKDQVSAVALSAGTAGEMEFRLVSGDGRMPVPTNGSWRIAWRSDDGMRVVATLVDPNPVDWYRSPVHVLDVDFANLRVKDTRAGGDLDFSEILHNPWRYECRRTN